MAAWYSINRVLVEREQAVGRASNRKKTLTRAERVGRRTLGAREEAYEDISIVGPAYHEAAHAVIGTLLGLRTEYVEITEEGRGFTSTPHPQWLHDWPALDGRVPLDGEQRAYLHATMLSVLAGALADGQFTHLGLRPDDTQDVRSDVGQVSNMLWRLVGGDEHEPVQRALDELVEETRVLLERHWSQVQAVAAALVERRRLTGSDVAALLLRGEGTPRSPAAR